MNDAPRQPEEEEVVDAEVVEDPRDGSAPPSTDLAPVSPGNAVAVQGTGDVVTLWNTHDPNAIVEQASKVATALANVIEKQDLAKNLGGRKKHVEIEGWQIAGTFLGAQPIITDTQRVEPKAEFPVTSKRKKWGKVDGKRQIVEETEDTWTVVGWSFDAVAEVRTMDGRVIGRGEATCSREEPNWKDATDSAVKGMAQTRACSRALRQALGFIVGLAGYSATPQEEMEAAGVDNRVELPPANDKQVEQFMAALGWLLPPDQVEPTVAKIRQRFEGNLPAPVAEAIAVTIGARKLSEETERKEAEAAAKGETPAEGDASSGDGSQPGQKPGDSSVSPGETTEEPPDEAPDPDALAEAERLERELEEELAAGEGDGSAEDGASDAS
jgi:hypothetical protein